MKKILILFSVLLIVFLIIVYVRHVPKLSGEYIEKISVIVHSEYGVKQYYIRDPDIITELCDEINTLKKTAFYDFLGRRAGGWRIHLRFFNTDGIEKRSTTFKKEVISYDGIINKTFYVNETIVDEIQKKLIEIGEEYENKR
ncbi:hypothetical protein [Qiania dongpingensis]|uniref:Uncharacterized protein n=1 Tax=Qiania dongpingensis TaxID=2763669 RepID=A0A7G9G5V6_9FIRM|nr:hypothetical protein [Qiania dongpingensis]QNM06188.1 hypothetical protein H9Q78_03260 [Qiania dongpingensis]